MSKGAKPIWLTEEERLDWLRLIRGQSVGPRTLRTLINHFGDARAALEALPALARLGGGSAVPKICSREAAEWEIEACRLARRQAGPRRRGRLPAPMQMIDDPPPLLAIRGRAAVFAKPRVAIVGSRNSLKWRSNSRGISGTPDLSSHRVWPAASTPLRIARASPREPSPFLPEGKIASIRPITSICSTKF